MVQHTPGKHQIEIDIRWTLYLWTINLETVQMMCIHCLEQILT